MNTPNDPNACPRILPSLGSRPDSRGFTLIELLIVLSVTVVLLAGAVPSLASIADSWRLGAYSNDFLAHMHLARSEAIKRQGRVAMCKSVDGESCVVTGGWEQGWIVFHDVNNNGAREAGEVIVAHGQSLASRFRLSGNQNVARYVSFASSGATLLINGGFQAGTLTVCRQSAMDTEARQIVINAAGRARVQKTRVPDCV